MNKYEHCPIWNRAALRSNKLLCPYRGKTGNNCGLFYDEETQECKLIHMTLAARMKGEK